MVINGNKLKSVELFSKEIIQGADCVVLTTNHDIFDIGFIQDHAQMIVDLRNTIKESSDKVYKL